MSDKEKNELLAAGKCFKCKETGHQARHCPQGSFMKSDKSGKAPGLPTYKIGLDLDEIKEVDGLRELADTTEELQEITCGAISTTDTCQTCTDDELRHECRPCPQEPLDVPCGAISFDIERNPQLACMADWHTVMGDAPAQIAERQLQAAQPYPGDTGQPFTDESRFLLVRIPEKEATYLINDLAHFVAVGHPCGWPVLVLFMLHCIALGGQDILAAVWGM
jgi:hypothetical protein